jgi:hypothetical protein
MLKQLLMQIAAVMAEKYGVPLAVVFEDPSWSDGTVVSDEDEEDIDAVYESIRNMRAVDANAMSLPGGIDIKYVAPGQVMPSFDELIKYCDQMIAMPFSNEGSLLGLQSAVGSYALGEVKERDAMRSAPYYARRIAAPLNRVIQVLAKSQLGELARYPRLTWRMDGMQDASAWIQDAMGVFQGPVTDWPEAAQAVALEKLGLPPDTFVVPEGEAEIEQTTDQQLIYKITNAMGAGLIARTPENIRQVHAFLNLPEPSDEQIAELLAAMPGEQAAPVANAEHEHGSGCSCCGPVDNAEAGGTLIECAEFDAEAGAEIMDRAEQQLAARFKSLGRELQTRWKVLIRDNETPADVLADRETIRTEFLPRYQEAVLEAVEAIGEKAGKQLLSEIGIEGDAPFAMTRELDLLTASVSEEALNRSLGVATDAQVDQERGDKRRSVPVLAAGTLALIASRVVSSAFNAARGQLIESLRERFANRTGRTMRVWAERSSVLDERTCGTCKRLDGKRVLVGSREYRNLLPPNKCEGRHRCRCVMRYSVDVATLEREGIV